MGVNINYTAWVQNQELFQNAYLIVMKHGPKPKKKCENLCFCPLKRKVSYGKLNKIAFGCKFCRICHLGRLSAITIDVLFFSARHSNWSLENNVTLTIKKSAGVDNISAKLLKSCSHDVSGLVNIFFATSTFPSSLKEAQVLPPFKKKETLKKENYRLVSVLPTTSKVYERTIHDQLTEHCDEFEEGSRTTRIGLVNRGKNHCQWTKAS